MVFDLMIFLLTVYKTMEAFRQPEMALSYVLLRDGGYDSLGGICGNRLDAQRLDSLHVFWVRVILRGVLVWDLS